MFIGLFVCLEALIVGHINGKRLQNPMVFTYKLNFRPQLLITLETRVTSTTTSVIIKIVSKQHLGE